LSKLQSPWFLLSIAPCQLTGVACILKHRVAPKVEGAARVGATQRQVNLGTGPRPANARARKADDSTTQTGKKGKSGDGDDDLGEMTD